MSSCADHYEVEREQGYAVKRSGSRHYDYYVEVVRSWVPFWDVHRTLPPPDGETYETCECNQNWNCYHHGFIDEPTWNERHYLEEAGMWGGRKGW